MRASRAILPAIAVVLTIALGILGFMQWEWIGELTAAQEERERGLVRLTADQFAGDIDRDLARLIGAFQDAEPRELPERLRRWRAEENDNAILRNVYIARGERLSQLTANGTERALSEWPLALAAARDRRGGFMPGRGPLLAEIPALAIPLRLPPAPAQDPQAQRAEPRDERGPGSPEDGPREPGDPRQAGPRPGPRDLAFRDPAFGGPDPMRRRPPAPFGRPRPAFDDGGGFRPNGSAAGSSR